MAEDTALNTMIDEPWVTAGDVEMLLFARDRSRAQFAGDLGVFDGPLRTLRDHRCQCQKV